LASSFGRLVILTVGSLSGEAGAGYFFQAQRLAIIPHQFLQPVTQRLAINYFSHKSSHDKQTKHLAKGLMSLSGILLLAVIIIRLGAPTVIPVVFGDSWRPVIPILIAMLGFVLCATMFNLLKGYCIATKNLKTLIVLGRSGQYLGFLSVATLVSILDYEPSVGLAFGLSLGYLLAAVSLTLKIFSKKEYSLL
ncbi:MAG: oligosaccharide flippase family protein, partial [Cyanobacteria bacterium J06649_11]